MNDVLIFPIDLVTMKLVPEVRQHLEYVSQINQDGPRIGNRYL